MSALAGPWCNSGGFARARLAAKLANKYGFIRTSNDYPDDPTTHEKIIRACAMRTHNTNRSMVRTEKEFSAWYMIPCTDDLLAE